MWNVTNRPDYEAGLKLLEQEYRATLADVKVRSDLTEIERLRLRYELTEEYRENQRQERKAIADQVRADQEAT